MPTTPTIVLVHGAWADASSWAGVIERLHAAGHTSSRYRTSFAARRPTLPIVRAYLETLDGPDRARRPTPTAASSSRMPRPAPERQGAGLRRRVHPGRRTAGWRARRRGVRAGPAAHRSDRALQARPDPRRAGGGRRHLPPAEHGRARASPTTSTPEDAALIHATQRPASLAAVAEPSGPPAWKDIPSWAMIGTQDRIIDPAPCARWPSMPARRITEIDASHVSMVSQPGCRGGGHRTGTPRSRGAAARLRLVARSIS